MVQQSLYNPKVKGLSQGAATETGRERVSAEKKFYEMGHWKTEILSRLHSLYDDTLRRKEKCLWDHESGNLTKLLFSTILTIPEPAAAAGLKILTWRWWGKCSTTVLMLLANLGILLCIHKISWSVL
jgi:hypothetical protein